MKTTIICLALLASATAAQAQSAPRTICDMVDKEEGYTADRVFIGTFEVSPTKSDAEGLDTPIKREGEVFKYKTRKVPRADWRCASSVKMAALAKVAEPEETDPLKVRNLELENNIFKRIEVIEQLYYLLCHEKGDERFCGDWKSDNFMYTPGNKKAWKGVKAEKN